MTDEQYELLVQAKVDAKTAAQFMKEHNTRAACSRAYYAMFYVARAILLDTDQRFTKHSALIGSFGKRAKDDAAIPQELHRELMFAFRKRGTADYDFQTKISLPDLQRIVDSAHRFVELGEKLLGNISLEDGD